MAARDIRAELEPLISERQLRRELDTLRTLELVALTGHGRGGKVEYLMRFERQSMSFDAVVWPHYVLRWPYLWPHYVLIMSLFAGGADQSLAMPAQAWGRVWRVAIS